MIAFMVYGRLALAQTEILYDFNSPQPLNGIEQASGSVEVVTLAGLLQTTKRHLKF